MDDPSKKATTVRISYVGYEDYVSDIPSDWNLGTVTLREATSMLDEITVTANLPNTRFSAEGMTTKVAGSILAETGTANDVLGKLPLVTGQDGDFTVFGRGVPVIYINGKKVTGKAELNELNSLDINSITVITNPGAEYSADTQAVIKIKTIPPKGEGFSVDFYNTTRVCKHVLNTDNIKITYRHNGLEFFANGYFYGGRRRFHDISTMYNYQQETVVRQNYDGITTTTAKDAYGKVGINYQLNDRHSIGAYYQYGQEKTTIKGTIDSDISNNDIRDISFFQVQNGKNNIRPIHEANLYYTGNIGKLGIDFNGDFLKKDKSSGNMQTETGSDIDRIVSTDASDSKQLWAEKLILSYPVSNGEFEVGEEYTDSRIKYTARYVGADISGGDVTIKEDNIAAIFKFRQSFGPIRLGVGLRYEHSNYRYFEGTDINPDLSRRYNDWLPSLSLGTKIRNVNLSLNLTERKLRPTYSQLDGTVLYVNSHTYQNGNPSLSPVNILSAQLMAQWEFLFAQATYTHEKNSIFSMARSYDGNPMITLMTFENVPKSQNFQFIAGTQNKVGCWSPSVTAGIFANIYSTEFKGKTKRLDKPYFFFKFDNTVTLPYSWRIDADVMWRTAGNSQNSYIKEAGYINIGVRKAFFNDQLYLKLRVNDILNTNNMRLTMYCGDIEVVGDHRQESRNVELTIGFNINSIRSGYKGTGAGADEKERF